MNACKNNYNEKKKKALHLPMHPLAQTPFQSWAMFLTPDWMHLRFHSLVVKLYFSSSGVSLYRADVSSDRDFDYAILFPDRFCDSAHCTCIRGVQASKNSPERKVQNTRFTNGLKVNLRSEPHHLYLFPLSVLRCDS